jgi:acyl-CoA dehydrogenase
MLQGLCFLALIGVCLILTMKQAAISVWAISDLLISLLLIKYFALGVFAQGFLYLIFGLLLISAIHPLRRQLLSRHLLRLARQRIPSMSATEREALEAGTVGWEGNLFSGTPDFNVLHGAPTVQLTQEEQSFLDNQVSTLCRMVDNWDITHNLTDMPQNVWGYIKEHGFLGMIIPKQYGGLEFSATAQMSVITKLYSHSITGATTVSVPNSLGPAELLLKYGTEKQKSYYLPRLADGREIPCFALTGPNAGSDAASIPDIGVVCHQSINGKNVLGIRLTWDKRYITLCPVATVIGLAFRLFDPEHLLGKSVDIGISCALIPSDTPGVIKGRRHFPLNTGFMNGPTQGRDVFISIDCLIGGAEMAGYGWRMLMECLSAGRAIGLPASASGGSQAAALACGAYARVRKQFHQPIAKFEGIEEPLARIAANTYIIDAALNMTAAAIDHGAQPSVAGAILKYHTTERARQVAVDAMDIHGGKGICLGPNNYLGRAYQESPISITVEGANILTRSLIIFGQGAIRCHPYVLKEMEGVKANDVVAFDRAIWSHFGFIVSNMMKSLLFSFTDARIIKVPVTTVVHRYYQLIHRYCSHLALLSDFSMLILGGELKRKEKLSARLGDLLSYLYLASAVLKRFHEDGEPESDLPLVDWSCQQLFHEAELAIQGVIHNFPMRWARIILHLILKPMGYQRQKPSDELGSKLARLLTEPNEVRTRLSRLVFANRSESSSPLGRLEEAFYKICAVDTLEKKVYRAVKEGRFSSLTLFEQIEEALLQGLLNKDEAHDLREAERARQEVIAVDDFSTTDLCRHIQSEGRGE